MTQPFFDFLFDKDDYVRVVEMQRRGKRLLPINSMHVRADLLHKVQLNQEHEFFFGVCPRPEPWANYEHQIRKVNFLWADVDDTKIGIPDVMELDPIPNLVVQSGRGLHLYWKLEDPVIISDAGTLYRVDKINKKKVFVAPNGDTWLPKWGLPPDMQESKIANEVRGYLRGVAAMTGGDHVYNLSRVMRFPGSYNTKTNPPTKVVYYPAFTRGAYQLEEFPYQEPPIQPTPTPTPVNRKAGAKLPRMVELLVLKSINACVGCRSEADFKLIKTAKSRRVDKQLLWDAVKKHGKFAEEGWDYFERTWINA